MKKILLFALILVIVCGANAAAQNVNLSVEKVWAERVSPTRYVLKKQTSDKWKVYAGQISKGIKWSNKAKVLNDSLVFEVLPTERLFFAAVSKKDTVIFSERRLWMEATPNFRDLGGLKTADGRTVAWNTLFRCGDMGQLSDNDLTVLKNINVRNVIDFRNDQEVSRSQDRYPKDQPVERVWASISPSNSEGMKKFYQVMADPKVTPEQVERVFEGFYAQMPEQIKNYAPFFATLMNAENGASSIFHCTAGKDRTGLGSALLLSALGVPEEVVIEEYYLSNRYTQNSLAKSPMMAALRPEIVSVLAGVKPDYIKASLGVIKAKYGSVNNMLEQELGIGPKERQKLIERYTY